MTTIAELQASMVDLQLETEVLGAILTFDLLDDYVSAGLSAEILYRREHATVLAAAIAVSEAGAVADVVTVGHQLRASGTLADVGPAYFSKLGDGVPRPDGINIQFHVARLLELYSTRLVHYANLKLAEDLKQPHALAEGVVGGHLDAVQEILQKQQQRGSLWLDAAGQLSAHQRDAVASASIHRITLGLPKLDAAMGGIRMGEVCGLLGRPGIGKTVLLTVVARAMAAVTGHVFFSLEMPASQIVGRLKQNLYNVGRHEAEERTKHGLIDEGLYLRTFDQLVIVDTPGLTVAEMGRRVRQIQKGPLRNVPIRLVTIDHLGLIGGDRALSTYDRVSVQAREIKELAKRLECAVLLAVQVNREAGGDGSRELGLGSARDSGVVEEAMDYMVGIRRLDRSQSLTPDERAKYKDVLFAKVIKNRHGDPGLHEVAYHFLAVGMDLREDPRLSVESEDIARLAQQRNGGRR